MESFEKTPVPEMEMYKQESFLGSAPGNRPHKGVEGKQDGTGGESEL